jgi:hypothetical protein
MREPLLPLSEAELEADAIGSYYAAVQAIGERVKAGEPVPASLRSATWMPRRREPSPNEPARA